MCRFFRDVRQFRHAELHFVRKFVGSDARCNLGIADVSFVTGVDLLQQIQRPAARLCGNAVRIGQKQDRVGGSAKLDALESLTRHMHRAESLEQAMSILLVGLTSGYGLAMNRAALFVRDANGHYDVVGAPEESAWIACTLGDAEALPVDVCEDWLRTPGLLARALGGDLAYQAP